MFVVRTRSCQGDNRECSGDQRSHSCSPEQTEELCRQEAEIEDLVILKVSLVKGVRQFGRRGKPASRFIGPFRISKRIGAVLHRLELPDSLSGVHDVFYISMLRKHLRDEEQ